MSKTHKTKIDYRLVQIEETGFSMQLPEDFKPATPVQFYISLQATYIAEQRHLVVANRIEMRQEANTQTLAHLSVNYRFELISSEELKIIAGIPIIPEEIQTAINAIVLSSSRGVLFGQFKGTPLHGTILPLIDAGNFAAHSGS